MTEKAHITSLQKADLITELAEDMKAERIERLDVRHKTSVTDFMIVCSGTSQVHAQAIGERVGEKLRNEHGIKPLRRTEMSKADGWILFDFGDVVFHVMLEEKRQFYDLETLWANLPVDPDLQVD